MYVDLGEINFTKVKQTCLYTVDADKDNEELKLSIH